MNRPVEVWRKSSASGGGQNGDCVELSNLGRVRDTKNPAVTLGFDKPAVAVLISAVKTAATD